MLAYIERIAVFVIIEGIFLRLTSNEDYKKMIKICCGMILIIIVLSPLDEVFGFTGLVTEFLQDITGGNRMEEIKEVYSMSDEKSIEQVRTEYEKAMKDSLKSIADEYGYSVNNVKVEFDDTRDNYIGSISVYLDSKTQEADNDGNSSGEDYENGSDYEGIEYVEKVEAVVINGENISGGNINSNNENGEKTDSGSISSENTNGENVETENRHNTADNIEKPDIIAIKNSIVDTYGIDYDRIYIYTS